MVIRYAALISLAVLTACTPLRTYYKEGGAVAQLERDRTDCEVEALAKVPVNTQIRYTPERYVPRREICNRDGKCVIEGGYYVGGEPYTVDVNEGLRKRVLDQCMAAKGYREVEIKRCDSGLAQSLPPARTLVMPPLTAASCAIRNADGSWRIVTPG